MVDLVKRASDVRTKEINLSAIIIAVSSAVGCQPVVSKMGSTLPRNHSNWEDYKFEYGDVDPTVSFTGYTAKDFYSEANDLWSLRVVGAGALTAGVLFYLDSSNVIQSHAYAVADPTNVDWAAAATSVTSTANKMLAFVYSARGPGSYAAGYDAEMVSSNSKFDFTAVLSAASTPFPTSTSVTYQVVANTPAGKVLANMPNTLSVNATHGAALAWPLVFGATSYEIYRNNIATPLDTALYYLTTVGGGTTSFIDLDALVLDLTKTAPATSATSTLLYVNVYETATNTSSPVESFDSTLGYGVNSSGVQTELENRINPFSSYVRVNSNVPALPSVPTIYGNSRATCSGGNSGSAPTSYNVLAALQAFANKQLYQVNLFMDSGFADPIVGKGLDALAYGRGDSVALLSTPAGQQKYRDAIDYRNMTLNLNSSYSALFCPDVLEADITNGRQVYVPFSGWAGALCARTDRVANPAASIAGLNRGLLNILKARYSYDDGEATQLFKAQVNYVRTFIGKGNALWEQQTLSNQTSALSWLSVRRIVNVIKVATYDYLLYTLQENNTDSTNRSLLNGLDQYLTAVKNAEGIYAYGIATETTPAARNAGILVVKVGIIPNIPIHEIQLNIGISKDGVSFEEVLNQLG